MSKTREFFHNKLQLGQILQYSDAIDLWDILAEKEHKSFIKESSNIFELLFNIYKKHFDYREITINKKLHTLFLLKNFKN